MAGFTYVYNGGKDCYFRYHESKQAEKLSKKQVSKIIKEDLQRDIKHLGIQPKSIIIHLPLCEDCFLLALPDLIHELGHLFYDRNSTEIEQSFYSERS